VKEEKLTTKRQSSAGETMVKKDSEAEMNVKRQ